MNENNSVLYVSICSAESSPGIYKKVRGFINGANKSGYQARAKIIEPDGVRGNIQFIYQVLVAKEQNIVVRYIPKLGGLFFLVGILHKLRNKNFFIDVPTPMTNHLIEILNSEQSGIKKSLNIGLIVLQGSIPFLSCKKIIQYSIESSFFSLFCKNKILLIGNGVCCDDILLRKNSPSWPDKTFSIVAVGTVAMWHGWDKVINVIAEINQDNAIPYNIEFTIVGDGPDLQKLIDLSEKQGISEYINFTGFLSGSDLDRQYEKAHYAIGSLGWERVGINFASPIKTREYLAAGVPLIYSTKDIDLSNISDNGMAINVDTSLNNKLLKNTLSNMHLQKIPHPDICRDFSISKLDFNHKAKSILSS